MSVQALHVQRRGDGPALMLLHGYTGCGADMDELARAFEREFETIAPDLPGHGRSLGQAADDFNTCLDALAATLDASGHRRAHWLGYSMGARLALALALRHPERVATLVLLAGRAGIEGPTERAARLAADEALAVHIESVGVEAFVDEWLAQPLFATLARLGPDFMAGLRRARLANDARGLAMSLRRLGPAAQPPLFAQLPRLDVPGLLLAGELDTRFVAIAHDLAGRLPRAEVAIVPDAGHAAHVEQPATFQRIVFDFLRRAAGPMRASSLPPVQETAS
jgi:2-succinyl-6-hydroxy-2,4-cyclohexadiene-1-carboxylate synthase